MSRHGNTLCAYPYLVAVEVVVSALLVSFEAVSLRIK